MRGKLPTLNVQTPISNPEDLNLETMKPGMKINFQFGSDFPGFLAF